MASEHEISNSADHSLKVNKVVAVLVAALVLIVAFGAGVFVGHRTHANTIVRSNSYSFRSGSSDYRGGFGFGPNSQQAGSRLTGVVTAVNGSTLTVIGDGTTNMVTTTSTTEYANNVMPNVNDTVTVLGSQGSTSGTFTATEIIVMNH